jgi:archaellum biogenesis ATPase FlaH
MKTDLNAVSLVDRMLAEVEETTAAKSKIITLGDLFKKEFPPVSWLVDRLIPKQGLTALSGPPASYKSWISQYLAIRVAEGKDLFDRFETEQGSVLIIDRENSFPLIQSRFKDLKGSEILPIFFLDLDFSIENKTYVDLVVNEVKERNISLVIIDSLIRVHEEDENTAAGMSKVFNQLRKIQDAGAAVLFLHHHRKQGNNSVHKTNAADILRGSSDIQAALDSHLMVEVLEEGKLRITQPKSRQDQPVSGFLVEFKDFNFIFEGEVSEDKLKLDQAKDDLIALLEEGEKSRQEIHSYLSDLGYSRNTSDGALRVLTEQGKLRKRKGEKNSKWYSIVDEDANDTPLFSDSSDQNEPEIRPLTSFPVSPTIYVEGNGETEKVDTEMDEFREKVRNGDTEAIKDMYEKGRVWLEKNDGKPDYEKAVETSRIFEKMEILEDELRVREFI